MGADSRWLLVALKRHAVDGSGSSVSNIVFGGPCILTRSHIPGAQQMLLQLQRQLMQLAATPHLDWLSSDFLKPVLCVLFCVVLLANILKQMVELSRHGNLCNLLEVLTGLRRDFFLFA